MRHIVQVGVGGYGLTWLDTVLAERERVVHAALVDVDEAALAAARARTGLPAERCFASVEEALAAVEADSVLCVVPPAHHEPVVLSALDAGKHLLLEKPIAATPAATRRIVERAARAETTVMVAQKGRFHPWVRRFREAVLGEEVGPISHLTLHYRAELFWWGAEFRHRMENPLLIEMSIHHFDLVRALLGRDPVTVSGSSWNTEWSGYHGDIAAALTFTMEDGVRFVYEAYSRSSGDLTSWYGDIRAEGAEGAITMVHPHLYLAHRGADQLLVQAPREDLVRVGELEEGQTLLFREFLDATDAGRAPESSLAENEVSLAMVFAAADACASGERRSVADYLTTAAAVE